MTIGMQTHQQAVRSDRAGVLAAFAKILCPIAISCFVWVVIRPFTDIWNEFLFGITSASRSSMLVMVALNSPFSATTGVKAYNVDMASVLIAAAPTLQSTSLPGAIFCAA